MKKAASKKRIIRVLVTGANGFIGRATVDHLLRQGYYVRALVRRPTPFPFVHEHLEIFQGDVCDLPAVLCAMKEMEYCVHLAARKSDELDSYEVNVTGTKNIIAACKKKKVRFLINISTLSTKIEQKGMYALTKDLADTLILNSTLSSVILKPSIVYGDVREGVFGSLVRFSRLPLIPVIGDGQQIAHPIHVKDLAQVIEKSIQQRQKLKGKVLDVGGPTAITLENFIRLIERKIHEKKRSGVIIHIPLWLGTLLAQLMKKVMTKPLLTESNILGSTQHIPITVKPLFSLLSFTPRTLEKAITDIPPSDALESEIISLWKYVTAGVDHAQVPSIQDLQDARQAFQLNTLQRPLPRFLLVLPGALGSADFLTKLFFPYSQLQQKLLIIAALIETTPSMAEAVLPKDHSLFTVGIECLRIGAKTTLYAFGAVVLGAYVLGNKKNVKNL